MKVLTFLKRMIPLLCALVFLISLFPMISASADTLLDAPTLSLNGDTLTIFHGSEDISEYCICFDDEDVVHVDRDSMATQVDLSALDLSDYEFDSTAHEVTVFGFSGRARLTESSDPVTWTESASGSSKLAAPTLALDGDVLTIVHSSGDIVKYAVYIDDEKVATVTRDSVATQIDLSTLYLSDYEFDYGPHSVTVLGCTDIARQTEVSDAVTWTGPSSSSSRLAAPTLTLNGDVLTIIHSSEDIPSYAIFVDGIQVASVARSGQSTQVDLMSLEIDPDLDISLSSGVHSITAVGFRAQTRLTEKSAAIAYEHVVVYTIKAGQWMCTSSSLVYENPPAGTPAEWPSDPESVSFSFVSSGSSYTSISCSYSSSTLSYVLYYGSTPVYRYGSTLNPNLAEGAWYSDTYAKIYVASDCTVDHTFFNWFTSTYTYIGSDQTADVVKTTVSIYDNTGANLLDSFVFKGSVAPSVTVKVTSNGCVVSSGDTSYTFTTEDTFFGLNTSAGLSGAQYLPNSEFAFSCGDPADCYVALFLGAAPAPSTSSYSFVANFYKPDGTLIYTFTHESSSPFEITLLARSQGMHIYLDETLHSVVRAGSSISSVKIVEPNGRSMLSPSEGRTYSGFSGSYVVDVTFEFSDSSSGGSGSGSGSGSSDSGGSDSGGSDSGSFSAFSGFGAFVADVLGGFLSVEFVYGLSLRSILEFFVLAGLLFWFLRASS